MALLGCAERGAKLDRKPLARASLHLALNFPILKCPWDRGTELLLDRLLQDRLPASWSSPNRSAGEGSTGRLDFGATPQEDSDMIAGQLGDRGAPEASFLRADFESNAGSGRPGPEANHGKGLADRREDRQKLPDVRFLDSGGRAGVFLFQVRVLRNRSHAGRAEARRRAVLIPQAPESGEWCPEGKLEFHGLISADVCKITALFA